MTYWTLFLPLKEKDTASFPYWSTSMVDLALLCFAGEDEPAYLTLARADTLQEQCVLCYSGPSEGSSDLHKNVWRPYHEGDETITEALRELRDSAPAARDALARGDFKTLGELLTRNREAARRLHPKTVSPRIDALFDAAARVGALGSKGCGAGGGGCLLFLGAAERRKEVEDALQEKGAVLIPFSFAPRTE